MAADISDHHWNPDLLFTQILSQHTYSLSNPTVSPIFNWHHLALQTRQVLLFEETREGEDKGVPFLHPCSSGTWVASSPPQKSPTAFPLPSTNLFSNRLQNHREHWETSQRSDLCRWVGIEMEVSYPWKHFRVEMITLSYFLIFLVFWWPTLLKNLRGKFGNISHTFLQSPPPNLFDGTSSCQQILIKRPFPAFEIAVLSLIEVWLQFVIRVTF